MAQDHKRIPWQRPAFVKLELSDTRQGDAPNADVPRGNNNTAYTPGS